MNDIELAKHLADKFHAGQKYGEFPYIYHLDMVARSVRRAYPEDERLVVVSWLHDILEDTACTQDILRTLFPAEIVNAVVAMTCGEEETRSEYLIRLRLNHLAAKVKLHDAWCNMTESFNRNDARRIRKYAETILVLTS